MGRWAGALENRVLENWDGELGRGMGEGRWNGGGETGWLVCFQSSVAPSLEGIPLERNLGP